MQWDKFWRWYDRSARVDFAGTLLAYIFDWRAWLVAVVFATAGLVSTLMVAIGPLGVFLGTLVAGAIGLWAYVGWSKFWDHWDEKSRETPNADFLRRKNAIAGARKFVARALSERPDDSEHFRQKLEADISFLNLRRHLSPQFLAALEPVPQICTGR